MVVYGLLAVGVVFAAVAFTVYFTERATNPEITTLGSAVSWTFLALLQGSPFRLESGIGKVLEPLMNLPRLALVGLLVAALTRRSLELFRKRSAGMIETDLKDHLVICGWSTKGSEIISEIRGRSDDAARSPIVVLAKLDADPTNDPLVTFVAGDPTSMADLRRAGIERAHTAIVLADRVVPGVSLEDVDSRTLLTVLAIESVNPRCFTCVEVVRSDNEEHFQRTNADELVISGQLTGALLAHSAVVRGLSKVVTDLISHPEDEEFYVLEVPADLDGSTFGDALSVLKNRHDCLPVALGVDGTYLTNPPATHRLEAGQRLLVISKEQPAV